MSTLSRWCSELATKRERAFVGSGNLQPEAEELLRLRRKNDTSRQEHDLLKKALITQTSETRIPVSKSTQR